MGVKHRHAYRSASGSAERGFEKSKKGLQAEHLLGLFFAPNRVCGGSAFVGGGNPLEIALPQHVVVATELAQVFPAIKTTVVPVIE